MYVIVQFYYLDCHHWQSNLMLAGNTFAHLLTQAVHKLDKIGFPTVPLMICWLDCH